MPDPIPQHLIPPPMDHTIGGGQPSQYTRETAGIILARAKAGETVKSIVADPAMPSYRTLYDWIGDNTGFGAAWLLMRMEQAAGHRARLRAQDRARAERRETTPRARSGRKSTYSRPRAKAVCAMIAYHGLTARQIGRRPRMPSFQTIHFWLRRHPDFRAPYAEACRMRDFMLNVDLHTVVGELTPANFPAIRRAAAVIEKKIADCEPRVWRWNWG